MRGGVTPRSGGIHVGARTSTQDGVVLPTVPEAHTAIGDGCLVGHHAHLECCTVESHCLIGFGRATVHRASIRAGAVIGTAALKTSNGSCGALAAGSTGQVANANVADGHGLARMHHHRCGELSQIRRTTLRRIS